MYVGEAQIKMKKLKKAKTTLSAGLQLAVAASADADVSKIRALMEELADPADMVKNGQYTEAIPLLQQQLEREPTNTACACDCAKAHLELDMARASIKYSDMALDVDASCEVAYSLKLAAQVKMGKKKKARSTLATGVKAVSTDAAQRLRHAAEACGVSLTDDKDGSDPNRSIAGEPDTEKMAKRNLNSKSVWNSKSTWEEVLTQNMKHKYVWRDSQNTT
jgi:thioredoxin-like negative regulator of GroEL